MPAIMVQEIKNSTVLIPRSPTGAYPATPRPGRGSHTASASSSMEQQPGKHILQALQFELLFILVVN